MNPSPDFRLFHHRKPLCSCRPCFVCHCTGASLLPPCPSCCPSRHLMLVPGDSLSFCLTPGFNVSSQHFQLTHDFIPGGWGGVTARSVKFQEGMAPRLAVVSYDLDFAPSAAAVSFTTTLIWAELCLFFLVLPRLALWACSCGRRALKYTYLGPVCSRLDVCKTSPYFPLLSGYRIPRASPGPLVPMDLCHNNKH